MCKALSYDLRKRIVDAVESGLSAGETAKRFEAGISTVHRLMRLLRETGSLAPRPRKGRAPTLDDAACDLMRRWLDEKNDLTLGELCSRLAEHGYEVTLQAVFYRLRAIGMSYKKNDVRQ